MGLGDVGRDCGRRVSVTLAVAGAVDVRFQLLVGFNDNGQTIVNRSEVNSSENSDKVLVVSEYF